MTLTTGDPATRGGRTTRPPARPGRPRRSFTGWVAVQDPDWRDRALCTGRDTEVWFPEDDQPAIVGKSYCRRCPVRADCLAHALERGERYGIWGGLTEHERDLLRARILAARTSPPGRKPGGDDGPVAA